MLCYSTGLKALIGTWGTRVLVDFLKARKDALLAGHDEAPGKVEDDTKLVEFFEELPAAERNKVLDVCGKIIGLFFLCGYRRYE